jgi:pimeloyl-ACP methyl ester carboxylesterase
VGGTLARVIGLDEWWAGGERLPEGVFTRADGDADAPVATWLHGFPISSWDWAKLHATLQDSARPRRDVSLDFLGFGASAKPAKHEYSLLEQADLVEAVWRAHGVTRTALVSHDYGVSVAQELLARRAEGALAVELTNAVFFNGGLFPALHRPARIQKLLAGRGGWLLARQMSASTFVSAYRGVLGKPPPDEELLEHWRAFSRDDGNHNAHLLLRYMAERREQEDRWVPALIDADLPKRFIWGPEDPVSGAHVIPELRACLGDSLIDVLDGIGHAPHMEAPEQVAPLLASIT